jgi:hypothetical protein
MAIAPIAGAVMAKCTVAPPNFISELTRMR